MVTSPGSAPLSRRASDAVRDPWVLLLAALGAGAAWATGIPVLLAAVIGVVMLATGTTLVAVLGGGDGTDGSALRLAGGTPQRHLLRTMDQYVEKLRELRSSPLAEDITSTVIEALSAAESSRESAVRKVAAIDALDSALEMALPRGAGRTPAPAGVNSSITRMAQRRAEMLDRLSTAADQVAEVYAKILELATSIDSTHLGGHDPVAEVSTSLDNLRGAMAALERADQDG